MKIQTTSTWTTGKALGISYNNAVALTKNRIEHPPPPPPPHVVLTGTEGLPEKKKCPLENFAVGYSLSFCNLTKFES